MITPTPDSFGLVGELLDGKYEIEAFVAAGGFAVVYRAVHTTLRKPVAVKVLRVPSDLEGAGRRTFLEKFAQEAQTIAALDHPAIVRVLDFGTSPMPVGEPAPWMVLEWITGTSLDADLEERRGKGGRTPAECLSLLRPVFEALTYAHEEGIAHRDIKPGNIMLATNKRGERTARVLDFGIAKVMNPEERPSTGHTATSTQQRSFSLFYASPEQIAGTRTGPWTDVYALSLMLTEMLTDRAPYDGDEVQAVYIDALNPRRPTPAKRGYDVGPWEPVLARAVSLKAAERYESARAFLAALEESVPATVGTPTGDSTLPPGPSPIPPRVLDTIESAPSTRDASRSGPVLPRSPGVRAVGFTLVAVLGLLVSALSYRFFSRPSQAPATRVYIRPNEPPPALIADPSANLPVAPQDVRPTAPSPVADGGGLPLSSPPIARAAPHPALRPLAGHPAQPPLMGRRPPAVPPTLHDTPRSATGHEIIPAE